MDNNSDIFLENILRIILSEHSDVLEDLDKVKECVQKFRKEFEELKHKVNGLEFDVDILKSRD